MLSGDAVLGLLWTVLARLGLAGPLRRGYFTVQAAPRGWQYRTQVGDASASLTTTTWFEYKRVRSLHGERVVLESLLSELREDSVFWDIGANVGLYSCLVADNLSSGAVVGFEPEPNNRERLRANLEANETQCAWDVSSVALSDSDTDGRLALDFDEEHRRVGAGHFYLSETDGLPVQCRRAATLIEAGYRTPDVVKIDVQGAELDVLRGFGERLQEVRQLYVELHTEQARRDGTTAKRPNSISVRPVSRSPTSGTVGLPWRRLSRPGDARAGFEADI